MEKDNRAIRYRVYPTEKQQDILQQTFGCARLLFLTKHCSCTEAL